MHFEVMVLVLFSVLGLVDGALAGCFFGGVSISMPCWQRCWGRFPADIFSGMHKDMMDSVFGRSLSRMG